MVFGGECLRGVQACPCDPPVTHFEGNVWGSNSPPPARRERGSAGVMFGGSSRPPTSVVHVAVLSSLPVRRDGAIGEHQRREGVVLVAG